MIPTYDLTKARRMLEHGHVLEIARGRPPQTSRSRITTADGLSILGRLRTDVRELILDTVPLTLRVRELNRTVWAYDYARKET